MPNPPQLTVRFAVCRAKGLGLGLALPPPGSLRESGRADCRAAHGLTAASAAPEAPALPVCCQGSAAASCSRGCPKAGEGLWAACSGSGSAPASGSPAARQLARISRRSAGRAEPGAGRARPELLGSSSHPSSSSAAAGAPPNDGPACCCCCRRSAAPAALAGRALASAPLLLAPAPPLNDRGRRRGCCKGPACCCWGSFCGPKLSPGSCCCCCCCAGHGAAAAAAAARAFLELSPGTLNSSEPLKSAPPLPRAPSCG